MQLHVLLGSNKETHFPCAMSSLRMLKQDLNILSEGILGKSMSEIVTERTVHGWLSAVTEGMNSFERIKCPGQSHV